MFPVELDHHILSSLPLPSEHATRRVYDVLRGIMAQRIVPYFRNRRGTDLIQLARLRQDLSMERLEDDDNRVRILSLITRTSQGWTIHLHERLFDYMAFVIPLKPELSLGESNFDERRVLACVEFLLRHNIEHILYPDRKEDEVIRSDVDLAMKWREDDPTAYRMLRDSLGDKTNGIRGDSYIELFDHAERGSRIDHIIKEMVSTCVSAMADLPGPLLKAAFPHVDLGIKADVLGECFARARRTSEALVKRAYDLDKVLHLFSLLMRKDQRQALKVFNLFKERWGLAILFRDLDLPVKALEDRTTMDLFELFRVKLSELSQEQVDGRESTGTSTTGVSPARSHAAPPPRTKSLNERIEEARSDPFVPSSVLDLIDKNRMNAAGQSGAKYAELIETLLAIPWGKFRKIRVSPAEFETGLNQSHYGLQKPKEVVSDFFANLIWRYQHFVDESGTSLQRTGSALLFVGPPGVGKTSLAISIARSLGIPYHKISLGGMRDEADIRGYGFTYEGSKPGPLIQGLIKMGAMNGMFIFDEADKTEKFAIATLLEILDPEQNHLFHDKYTQSTIDIDLSNSHFILTANTLETVPPPILDRCEVIHLDRYSVEEKIAIARNHLIQRVREKYMIDTDEIYFDDYEEGEILRNLITNYTFEAGVRDLERIIRTIFLRIHRKEIIARGKMSVKITGEKVKEYLDEPTRPRSINAEDRVGEMMGLGVNMEVGMGSLIPIQVTRLRLAQESSDGQQGYMSIAHATGNLEKVMDESRKVASTAIAHAADQLGIDLKRTDDPVHLHFMAGSTKKDGPSAGGAIALALASLLLGRRIRRDVAMTGEIDTQGRITGIGGLGVKLETAYAAGIKTMIIPRENLYGVEGIERLPEALKRELQILTYKQWKAPHEPFDYTRHVLQVVAVDHILQAADIAFIEDEEVESLQTRFIEHARKAIDHLAGDQLLPIRRLRVILVSDPDELDTEFLRSGFCDEDHGCVLLLRSGIRNAVMARLSSVGKRITFRDFDPDRETLTDVIEEIRKPFLGIGPTPLRMSLIAPHHVLKRDGIRVEDFAPDQGFVGLRIFASCCTVENVRIKDCRNIVNRAYRQLARLDEALIDACPFLRRKDGIYMVSLSFIPEKYRLDVQRSEEILYDGLAHWLELMEGYRGEDAEERQPGLAGNNRLALSAS